MVVSKATIDVHRIFTTAVASREHKINVGDEMKLFFPQLRIFLFLCAALLFSTQWDSHALPRCRTETVLSYCCVVLFVGNVGQTLDLVCGKIPTVGEGIVYSMCMLHIECN